MHFGRFLVKKFRKPIPEKGHFQQPSLLLEIYKFIGGYKSTVRA
jgi:hypothetical protein